ncbi:MAG: M24 family metallopeptidase [Lapillicoccus sp.]
MADDRWADLPAQLAAIAAVGRGAAVTTVVLRDPATLTWLLGCRVHVPQTLDTACLDVLVDLTSSPPRLTVVTNAIEAPRLRETELAGLEGVDGVDVEWGVLPWWEDRAAMLPAGPGVGSDRPTGRSVALGTELATLRRRLTPRQQRLLRVAGRDTAEAATAAAQRLAPTTTEYAAAGILAAELLTRGLDPIVLMACGDARMAAHRHPLPTHEPLGARGMLVACGRRDGLVTSVTRIVAFGRARGGAAAPEAYQRLLRVEQAYLDATRVGARLGDAFATGAAAYGREGFDPDEWHRHHQGGFSGFQPREFPASQASDHVIPDGSVVAWNPSGSGWKVEDTTLVLPTGPDPLVMDEDWPTTDVGGRRRPDVLLL